MMVIPARLFIHPNEEGIKLLGKAVADIIREQGESEYLRPEEKLIQ